MKSGSAQFLRKRKLYLALPLLVLPFVTLAFWAMGGGREITGDTKTAGGLNLQLPDARLKDDKNFDKLSFYDIADKDSLKHIEDLRSDPSYEPAADTGFNVVQLVQTTGIYKNNVDANEEKIYKKINDLKQQINAPAESKVPPQNTPENNQSEQFTKQVDKLHGMMQTMNDKPEKDTEMEQIANMLDKILDIQHPGRIKDQGQEKPARNKGQVFSVQAPLKNESISLMQSPRTDTTAGKVHNRFYDLDNSVSDHVMEDHAIEAVVHETQTVVSGATIKLRLANDVYVNGIIIPKGNFIYGIASLENERLSIHISAIRYQSNLMPVALEVYDMDGLAGIHIPGSIPGDVVRQSAGQNLQNIELATFDPSLAAQAANTGVQAAKTLLAKKARLVKVTLKAGYKVLLKDNNKNNNN